MSWSPNDYQFQPYELQAQRVSSAPLPLNSDGSKRKGGRQRRSSILCQVRPRHRFLTHVCILPRIFTYVLKFGAFLLHLQVDGCGIELINEKTYYKRYRICTAHCNMKSMVIQGRRQRFCQQCGRFHDVTEFEGSRKSCRRKLQRHNQRRRTVPSKGCAWQSDSDEDEIDVAEDAEYQALANMKRGARSRSARFNLDIDGPSPKKPPKMGIASPSCSMQQQCYHASLDLDNIPSASNIAGFVPLTEAPAGGSSDALKDLQQPQQPLSSSDGGAVTKVGIQLVDGAGSARNSPDTRLRNVAWSTSALPPLQSNTSRLPAPPQQQHQEPLSSPFGAKDTHFFSEFLDDDLLGGLLMFPEDISDSLVVSEHDQLSGEADGTNAVELQAPPGYGMGAAGMGSGAVAAAAADVGKNRLQPDFAGFGELNTATSPRQGATVEANHEANLQQHQATAGPTTALEAASRAVSMDTSALVGYSADDSILRLSIKLFNCTPDFLAPGVKSELTSLLRVTESSHVEGYIRPGCVHMTLSVRAPSRTLSLNKETNNGIDAEGASHGNLVVEVKKLLEKSTSFTSEAKDSMLVQLHDELIVVKQKKIIAAIDMGKSMGVLPQILAVRPFAVVATGNGTGRTTATLAGRRLNDPSSLIMCRQGGRNLTIELPDDSDDEELNAETAAGQVINLGVLGIAAGCAEFEVQIGSFLGTSRPLVSLPDAAAVEEIRQLETANNKLADNLPVDSFLRDLGLIAQYLDREYAQAGGRPVPTYTPELLTTIQKIACKLVAAAVSRKWIALTAYLLPATTAAGQSKEEAVAIMDAACPPGSALLHVAVGTGNVEIVKKLAQWGDALSSSSATTSATTTAPTTRPFTVNAKGLGGITPLHVAAILPPNVCHAMRLELTTMSSAVSKLWGLAQSDDGITPEGLVDIVAGGGPSSGSGIAANRIETPFSLKPTPFDVSVSTLPADEQIGAGFLDAMEEKTSSFSSVSGASMSSRNLSWKSRSDAKAVFVDHHIGNMMYEVCSLPKENVNVERPVSSWHVSVAVASAMALALGTAAMALRLA